MAMLDSKFLEKALHTMQAMQEVCAKQIQDDTIGMGDPTEHRCSCGGTIHWFDPTKAQFERLMKEVGKPRYSRRKRQAKKNHKKWLNAQNSKVFLATVLARPLRNPMGFRCALCGHREGFYSMMAKAMFKIEPMPEGAKVIY